MPVVLPPWLYGYSPGTMVISGGTAHAGWSLSTKDTVDFDVEEIGFSPPAKGNFLGSVSKEELLLCVGLATSPATSWSQPSAWGFFVEHLDSLRTGSGRLRSVASLRGWDSHDKGRFADRMGMGAAAWALWRHHGVVHIADAEPFIGKALANATPAFKKKWLKSLGIYGKDGKYKPDYFCLDNAGDAVIAEAKGANGAPSAVSGDIKKGKLQVANVNPVGVPLRANNNRLVLAINIRREDEKPNAGKDTALRVVDPDGDDEALSVAVSEDELVRYAYAKVMSFCGQPLLADLLIRRRGPIMDRRDVERSSESIGGTLAVPLLQVPGLVVGLESGLAWALWTSAPGDLVGAVRRAVSAIEALRRERGTDQGQAGIILPNGVVARFGAAGE